jgi:thioredoxin 1
VTGDASSGIEAPRLDRRRLIAVLTVRGRGPPVDGDPEYPRGYVGFRDHEPEKGRAVSVIDLTQDTFETTVTGNDIVLVDWWAEWCGPCKMFAPVFSEAAEQHDDIVFAKIDTQAEQELAGGAGIMSIPTLMAFRENVLIFSQPGALPAAALEDLIAKIRDVDMDEVHRAVAEQQEDPA